MGNPLIEPYDYFKGYKESAEKLKNDPATVAFDRLCYEVFEHNESGKRLLGFLQERYLMALGPNTNSESYINALTKLDGLRELILIFINSVRSHSQRIKAETNKA